MSHRVAMPLTAASTSALAVVRLSGPAVLEFLNRHFSGHPTEGRCIHGNLTDGGTILDDPVVVLSGGGTVADLSLHGSPWIVRSVLELARREGFRVVDRLTLPLSIEAVDAETLLAREVLMYLPLARTEWGVRVLLNQGRAWAKVKEDASRCPQDVAKLAQQMLNDHSLLHLLYPPRVAIVGAANVGKSTLANQLFAQERSITADVPGTTRDWVGEIANLDGLPVMLVDTPGLRETDDPIEAEAIAQSREQIEAAELVVLVLDGTRHMEGEQAALLERFPAAPRVLNKCDRPAVWDASRWEAIHTVATTGQGVDDLRSRIRQHFGSDPGVVNRPHAWTNRQRQILERARLIPGAIQEM